MSPTLSIHATQAGIILGTAAYMAPEQARGKTVDKRADMWAFGVVLHELSTGERLFNGSEVTDILASVLKDQPSFEKLPSEIVPLLIVTKLEQYDYAGATAIAVVMLAASFLILLGINALESRARVQKPK